MQEKPHIEHNNIKVTTNYSKIFRIVTRDTNQPIDDISYELKTSSNQCVGVSCTEGKTNRIFSDVEDDIEILYLFQNKIWVDKK